MIKKILIVDDSGIARKMLRKCIPKEPCFEFFEATNGEEGLNMYNEIKPDITFMDLTMPVMGGAQALEEIKKVDEDAIVIVCTADVQMKSITKVMALGAFTIVKKPPTEETLADALLKASDSLKALRARQK